MVLFSLRFLILSAVIILNGLLIFLVLQQAQRTAVHKIFFALGTAMSFWLVATYFSGTPVANLWWTRLTVCSATLMSMILFLLGHTLPAKTIQLTRKQLWAIGGGTLLVMLITLSPFTFTKVDLVNGVLTALPGPGMLPFAMLTTFFTLSTIYFLFKKFRFATGVDRKQLSYVLVGIALMLGLVISTIMIPVLVFNSDYFVQFAPIYALLFLTATAIAILRYGLFDVKLIATEFLVAVLIVTLIFEGFFSGSLQQLFLKILFAGFVAVLGSLLIQSVKKEIKRREEVTKLAQALERANIRLKELDQQKTEFLSIASHQLRTPLSIISGYIELIKDGGYGKVGNKVKKILDNMDESNSRLVKLIDEFLDITRIEQGRTKFVFKPSDMAELITSVMAEFKDRAAQKGIKLAWEPPTKVPQADIDEDKVRHVIFNFIDNAIKYSDHGTIHINLAAENGGMAVRVTDNGLGFNQADEVNFFQKFYRGENVKKTEVTGTGLGLYVCRKFIEAHRGRVWCHSPGLGKGSEFGLWVPQKHGEEEVKVQDDAPVTP